MESAQTETVPWLGRLGDPEATAPRGTRAPPLVIHGLWGPGLGCREPTDHSGLGVWTPSSSQEGGGAGLGLGLGGSPAAGGKCQGSRAPGGAGLRVQNWQKGRQRPGGERGKLGRAPGQQGPLFLLLASFSSVFPSLCLSVPVPISSSVSPLPCRPLFLVLFFAIFYFPLPNFHSFSWSSHLSSLFFSFLYLLTIYTIPFRALLLNFCFLLLPATLLPSCVSLYSFRFRFSLIRTVTDFSTLLGLCCPSLPLVPTVLRDSRCPPRGGSPGSPGRCAFAQAAPGHQSLLRPSLPRCTWRASRGETPGRGDDTSPVFSLTAGVAGEKGSARRRRAGSPRAAPLPRPPPAARLMSRARQECGRVINHPAGSRRSRPNHI